ncbi:MAG: cytochrome d ubiquinol oxidase subunit II, partial [Herbiconiux sp.]|nr:cytochrome d ubiquinol oxidase subunit II [Herbiconiux sp.]
MDLTVLWFGIVGFLFVGYFVLDGFDFGVGMSLPFLGKDDTDRRVLINTIGPVWDLNETWVIVAGAALFAAFPEWYATLFSGFYLPLLLILLALILRGVSFEYRHQRPVAAWKKRFDRMIVIGSAVPAFLWGVAFSNIVAGVPLDEGHNYIGTVFDLLNPYALLGGLTTLLLFFT